MNLRKATKKQLQDLATQLDIKWDKQQKREVLYNNLRAAQREENAERARKREKVREARRKKRDIPKGPKKNSNHTEADEPPKPEMRQVNDMLKR